LALKSAVQVRFGVVTHACLCVDDWNLGEKSARWQFQGFLEKLQFVYGVEAFFTINIVADEQTENANMIEVRV